MRSLQLQRDLRSSTESESTFTTSGKTFTNSTKSHPEKLDKIVNKWVDIYLENKVFIAKAKGAKIDLAQVRKAKERYVTSLREKVERDPAVLEYMEYVLKTEEKIKKKVKYDRLIQKYLKGQMSLKDIGNILVEAAQEMGVDEYIRNGFMNFYKNLRFEKSRYKDSGEGKIGAHHWQLSHMRRGDVCAGGWGSSSSSSNSSGTPNFGHAAIWTANGDPHPRNERSHVAMSAWVNPSKNAVGLHEPDNETGYDFRRCWDGGGGGPVYLMRVYTGNTPASSSKAEAAASWAEAQRSKPFFLDLTFGKSTTDDFYCSLLVWHSWKRQGIDLDSHDYFPTDGIFNLVVFPYDIYIDYNTRLLYSY